DAGCLRDVHEFDGDLGARSAQAHEKDKEHEGCAFLQLSCQSAGSILHFFCGGPEKARPTNSCSSDKPRRCCSSPPRRLRSPARAAPAHRLTSSPAPASCISSRRNWSPQSASSPKPRPDRTAT